MSHNNPLIMTALEGWLLGHSSRCLSLYLDSTTAGHLLASIVIIDHNGEEVYTASQDEHRTVRDALLSTLYAAERHTLEGGLS